VANANAYDTLAAFKQYHDDRGGDYSAYTDPQIQTAIVRATQYVDSRFLFPGVKLNPEDAAVYQTTEWPRNYVYRDGVQVEGIPLALKSAVHEYAFRALSIPLLQDAPAPSGGRLVNKLREKVDVIETETEYAASTGGAAVMPAYPAADFILLRAGLTRTPGLSR